MGCYGKHKKIKVKKPLNGDFKVNLSPKGKFNMHVVAGNVTKGERL